MMRKFLLVLWVPIAISCGSNQDKSATTSLDDKLPKIEFAENIKEFSFGTISEGQQVEHLFKFKNAGDFPLIINNVAASCGCTIPEWPHEPIGPDEESAIKVRFNSKGKVGPNAKTVTIYANTNPTATTINFTVEVVVHPDSVKKQLSN